MRRIQLLSETGKLFLGQSDASDIFCAINFRIKNVSLISNTSTYRPRTASITFFILDFLFARINKILTD